MQALFAPLALGAQTFGVSLKGQGFYVGHETTVFTRDCSATEVPCAMQHFWSGGFIPAYGSSLLRYYVDGEQNASVVIPLGLGHGQAAMMDDNAPWSAGAIMGKTGVGYVGWGAGGPQEPDTERAGERNNLTTMTPVSAHGNLGQDFSGAGGSGLFNAYLIPFGSNVRPGWGWEGAPPLSIHCIPMAAANEAVAPLLSLARHRMCFRPAEPASPHSSLPLLSLPQVRVTLEFTGPSTGHLVIFWVVLRGRTKAALHLPGTPSVSLPASARLRSYYTPERPLQPLETVPLYNSSAANGAVLLVTLSVTSAPTDTYPPYHYLEGCMRAYTPSGERRFRISSGTEDYFLGTCAAANCTNPNPDPIPSHPSSGTKDYLMGSMPQRLAHFGRFV